MVGNLGNKVIGWWSELPSYKHLYVSSTACLVSYHHGLYSSYFLKAFVVFVI